MDALSLRSDVMNSIKIHSLLTAVTAVLVQQIRLAAKDISNSATSFKGKKREGR